MGNIKELIEEELKKVIEEIFGEKPDSFNLTSPPDVGLGDFTVSCFHFVKKFKENPANIAKKIAAGITTLNIIKNVSASGPYLNIKIKNSVLFRLTCINIIKNGDNYGKIDEGNGKKVMIEYLSPNTNKPLHLGHVRNGSLGMAISNILKSAGNNVIRANLLNDRGAHICKSMLAWQKWGNGQTPETENIKGDHFVGKWYVRYAKEAELFNHLEEEVQKMLQKWENGDPETVQLWDMMNNWVYQGFSETYKKLGLKFDVFYYESETYKLGKNIVSEGIEKGVFAKDQYGNIVFYLPEKFTGSKSKEDKKVTVLRSNGTSLYVTQDIATALLKVKEHGLDSSVYVVGSEQIYHFQCLFEILKSLGYSWADSCYHLSYGMVYLPEGKMKSREGKVVDADDLIAKVKNLAADEIRVRHPENNLSAEEIERRAEIIGDGAIKFYLLKVKPYQDINFNPEESISFDGFTGPYCQYAYARISSILKNADYKKSESCVPDFSLLGNEEELALIQKLIQFPEELRKAAEEYNPSRIAGYVFSVAKAFNQFYNRHKVLNAENKSLEMARLDLVKSTAVVIKNSLSLLGINTLEEM